MDRDELIGFIQKNHNVRIPHDDPVLVSATIFEAYTVECRTALTEAAAKIGKIVTDAAEKTTASAKAAESAAVAKAETLVTQAGEYAASKFAEAGDLAIARIQRDTETATQRGEAASRRAVRVAYSVVFAFLCLVSFAIGVGGVRFRWW